MTARMAEARKEALLAALAETGNLTLAAERAKLSRSWALKHRQENPAFDGRCREAVAAARERLRRLRASGGGGTRPAEGWGFLDDGSELVVRGGNGRRCQIARARLHQWTPRIEDRFLQVLGATCNVKAACAAAGMTKGSAYAHRRRWPAFAERWEVAIEYGAMRLKLGLLRHASNMFSGKGQPAEVAMPRLSVDEMLHNLYMHQHQVDGIGKAPGLPPREYALEEACSAIIAAADAIEAGERLDPDVRAQDEAEWARRRGIGCG